MKGRVRDFTEELFGELGGELGKDFADDNTDQWFADGWDELWTLNKTGIGEESKNINKYLSRVCEENDITNEMLNEIFIEVRSIEGTYSGKTSEVIALLTDYRDILKLFREEMRKFVQYGKDELDMQKLKDDIQNLSDSILSQRLAIDEAFAQELQEAMNRYVNEDGSYNWDAIEEAMSKDTNTITEAELMALSLVYLSMEDPQDINRFIYLGYSDGIPEYLMTDDESTRTFYYGTEMTDLFRKIVSCTEQIAVTAAYIYQSQNEELSEELKRMLRNAEMLSYAAAYAPEGNWMVVTYPDGSATIEVGPCFVRTDNEGNMFFWANGEIEFSYNPETIGISDFDELIGKYASENMISGGDVFWNIVSDVALSTAIAVALTLALPEAVVGGIIVGAAIDTFRSTYSEFTDQNSQNLSLSNLVRTSAAMAAYGLLGAEVYIVKGSDSRYYFFGANLNTADNIIYTYGFLNNRDLNTYGLSQKELEAIICNGNPKNDGWKPIENSRLSEAEQKAIYEKYVEYVEDSENYRVYKNSLQKALDVSSTVDKDNINDCTPEELKRLAAESNEGV